MSPRSWHKYDAVSPVDAPGTARPKDDLYHPVLVQTAGTWNFDASTKRVNSVSPDAYGKEREVSTNAGGPEPTIGWMSTALLVGLYFIALLVAILHLVMMRTLNGKPTDDKKYLAQPYVTSLSVLLVAIFKASLSGSLAIAFTQRLWKLLRSEPLHVSMIESLHGVRHNPFLLGKWQIVSKTPLLYTMALLMWMLAVVILFPPSALTIVLHGFAEQESTLVPIFDPASGRDIVHLQTDLIENDARAVGHSSLSLWTMSARSGVNRSMSFISAHSKLSHLTKVVLVSGAVPESPSPCGPNCTYAVEFEGPTFKCETTVRNETIDTDTAVLDYYSGEWGPYIEQYAMSGSFVMNVSLFPGFTTNAEGNDITSMLRELHTMDCRPAWAKYGVQVRYDKGLRAFSHHIKSVQETLQDTLIPGLDPWAQGRNDPHNNSALSVDLNDKEIQNLKCFNNYAILDSIVKALSGTYQQRFMLDPDRANFTTTNSNGTTMEFMPFKQSFGNWAIQNVSAGNLYIEPNKTLIRDSHFNVNRDSLTNDDPSFVISESILNEIVANVTIAAMLTYYPLSTWNTSVTANITNYRNMYSFSRPINLLLPYGLALICSLPFLVTGYLSLRSNGVAAMGDSFVQLLTTMTRSEELDRLAKPCGLGGDEMASKELKEARIMFGEILAKDDRVGVVRRLGFGGEGEVVRLRP